MSLFNKLFKKRRNPAAANAVPPETLPDMLAEWEMEPLGPGIPFSRSQLRLVVFRETEAKGRQILFDSASFRPPVQPDIRESVGINAAAIPKKVPSGGKLEPSANPAGPEINLEEQRRKAAQVMRPNRSDLKMLSEMIFGSIPIQVRSVITKVHELRTPPQIMLTKVYPTFEPKSKGSDTDDEGINSKRGVSGSRTSSFSSDDSSLSSPPQFGGGHLSIPDRIYRNSHSASPILTPSTSTGSLTSLPFSPPQYHAMSGAGKRRLHKNSSTNIESGAIALVENSMKEEEFPEGFIRTRKGLVTITCLVSLPEKDFIYRESFHEFFFTHSPVFEYALNLFKYKLEEALTERPKFMELVLHAYQCFMEDLVRFIIASRLPRPMWLIIAMEKIPDESYIAVLRLRFIMTFVELWKRFDTKDTQFFLSRLLTGVLAGHLGWVATVTPSDAQTDKYRLKHTPGWMQTLVKSHPYNPLWAQLSDLLGICGSPPRLTKTILVSKNKSLLSVYLHFISYFIRTSDVLFHRFELASSTSSLEDSTRTLTTESPEISRAHRYQSGDAYRSVFNKTRLLSGHRTRLNSLNEQNLSRPGRHLSAKQNSVESHGLEHSVDGKRTRHMTVGALSQTNSSARRIWSGLRHASSQASIKENDVFMDGGAATDDHKLVTVCAVASALGISGDAEVSKSRRPSSTLSRPDSMDKMERDGLRSSLRHRKMRTLCINKPDRPLILHVEELPVPRFRAVVKKEKFEDIAFESTAAFATSLLSAPTEVYNPYFALQGCNSVNMSKLVEDLQVAAECSLTDENCPEASAIVANLDDYSVRIVSCQSRKFPSGVTVPMKKHTFRNHTVDCPAAGYVMKILEDTVGVWESRTTPEYCLMYLEDRLQEIYTASRSMVDYIEHQNTIDTKEMMGFLGHEMTDFPLLLAVASTHAPDVVTDLNLVE